MTILPRAPPPRRRRLRLINLITDLTTSITYMDTATTVRIPPFLSFRLFYHTATIILNILLLHALPTSRVS